MAADFDLDGDIDSDDRLIFAGCLGGPGVTNNAARV